MGDSFQIIDILVIASGLYVLYTYYQIKVLRLIKESILLPKGIDPKHCTDKDAYIDEVAPKVLIYGLIVIACGGIGLAQSHYNGLLYLYIAALFVFLGLTVWFSIATRNAFKKYWPQRDIDKVITPKKK